MAPALRRRRSGSTSRPAETRCACGERYAHDAWCALRFIGVRKVDAERRDTRDCGCGATLSRVLPAMTSVCIECGEWTLGTKIVTVDGVHCAKCAEHVVAAQVSWW